MNLIWIVILVLDLVLSVVFRATKWGVENRGVSFGMASEVGFIISIVAFCLFVGLLAFEIYKRKKIRPFLLLITLGGLGNIVSRLIWGSVWDYICLPLLPFCFNLCDVLISLGVVSYILGGNGDRSSVRRQRDNNHQ